MQVIIKEEVHEIPVTSVWLAKDPLDPEGYRLKMFFCPNCQNPVIQYKGHIVTIVPGACPSKLPILAKCSNCKMRYLFEALE